MREVFGIGLALRYCQYDALTTPAIGIGNVVAKAEAATLHGRVKLILVAGHILAQIENEAIELAHVLSYWVCTKLSLTSCFSWHSAIH